MVKLRIEIDDKLLKKLVVEYIKNQLGVMAPADIDKIDIPI